MFIRPITSISDLRQCEEIERVVWKMDDLEVMPAAHMAASVHAGSLVAGAFDGDMLIGFVYGFIAHHPEEPSSPYGFHSHLMAVLAPHRGGGVGRQLKWFQRNWCLDRGLPWITWTFDPLQAKNARLNLERLGAVVREYREDAYGQLGGSLNFDLPTDRFLARWELNDELVVRLAAGERASEFDCSGVTHAVRIDDEGLPCKAATPPEGAEVLVEIPADITSIMEWEPEKAHAWRLTLRETFAYYFARGYETRRFVSGSYLLERPTSTGE